MAENRVAGFRLLLLLYGRGVREKKEEEYLPGRVCAGYMFRSYNGKTTKWFKLKNFWRRKNMKKFLVILLALALVVAFSMPAGAVDVKFKGSYTAMGYYSSNRTLLDADKGTAAAKYFNRFRLSTIFKIAEGLKVTTRFDALEGSWSGHDSPYRSFQWERAYVTFAVPFGKFDVGYRSGGDGAFGTFFGQSTDTYPMIKYTNAFGPVTVIAHTIKYAEAGTTATDQDKDQYGLGVIYKWDAGNAGLYYQYINDATDGTYKSKVQMLSPYAKASFGPLYVEGQVYYLFGKAKEYEDGGGTDQDKKGLSYYINGKYKFGPAYVGAMYAYVSGQDDSDDDTAGQAAGADWALYSNNTIVLWDYWHWKTMGDTGGKGYSMTNAKFFQVYAGMSPLPKLSVTAALSYAKADEKGSNLDDDYGKEFDISATYKIYKNLSYMVGFGYLWTGDYFKGSVSSANVDNDYVLLNKLTVKF